MASNEKHFDALGFVQKSKELGVSEQLAEYQARQLENVIDIASHATKKEVDGRELATKMDLFKTETSLKTEIQEVRTELKAEIQELRTELKSEIQSVRTELHEVKAELKGDIKDLRYDSLKFTIWTGVGVVFSMIILFAKGFHWF